jgi:hypothetical protein
MLENVNFKLALKWKKKEDCVYKVGLFVLNVTFNNISVISRRSVLIGEGNRSVRRKALT